MVLVCGRWGCSLEQVRVGADRLIGEQQEGRKVCLNGLEQYIKYSVGNNGFPTYYRASHQIVTSSDQAVPDKAIRWRQMFVCNIEKVWSSPAQGKKGVDYRIRNLKRWEYM